MRLSLSLAAGAICRADSAAEWNRENLAEAVSCKASCCLIGAGEMSSIVPLQKKSCRWSWNSMVLSYSLPKT